MRRRLWDGSVALCAFCGQLYRDVLIKLLSSGALVSSSHGRCMRRADLLHLGVAFMLLARVSPPLLECLSKHPTSQPSTCDALTERAGPSEWQETEGRPTGMPYLPFLRLALVWRFPATALQPFHPCQPTSPPFVGNPASHQHHLCGVSRPEDPQHRTSQQTRQLRHNFIL